MELKVWVEGIQRIVCGVTEATTCQVTLYSPNFLNTHRHAFIPGHRVRASPRHRQVRKIHPDRALAKQRTTTLAARESNENPPQMGRILKRRPIHTAMDGEQQTKQQIKIILKHVEQFHNRNKFNRRISLET